MLQPVQAAQDHSPCRTCTFQCGLMDSSAVAVGYPVMAGIDFSSCICELPLISFFQVSYSFQHKGVQTCHMFSPASAENTRMTDCVASGSPLRYSRFQVEAIHRPESSDFISRCRQGAVISLVNTKSHLSTRITNRISWYLLAAVTEKH